MRINEVGLGNERAVVEGPFHTSVLLMKQRDDESLDPINIRSNRRRISLMHWGERCTSLDVRAPPFAHHLRRRPYESCSTVSHTGAQCSQRQLGYEAARLGLGGRGAVGARGPDLRENQTSGAPRHRRPRLRLLDGVEIPRRRRDVGVLRITDSLVGHAGRHRHEVRRAPLL